LTTAITTMATQTTNEVIEILVVLFIAPE
jgi:hypothetical protein